MVLLLFLSGCANQGMNAEEARTELGSRSYSFTENFFMEAINRHDTEAVELFLLAGMHPNVLNEEGGSPLMLAAYLGYNEIATLLLDYEAEPNIQQGAPLFYAVENGHSQVVETLLSNGADVELSQNGYAETTTLLFVASRNDHPSESY